MKFDTDISRGFVTLSSLNEIILALGIYELNSGIMLPFCLLVGRS